MEVLSPLLPLAQREGPSSTPWPVATVSQTTGAPSDRELVARAASGKDQAIGQLYDRYGAMVYTVAYRILRDETDAEEAVMDTFAQAWRQADRFAEARGSVAAWLTMIARSRSLDMMRARSRREHHTTRAEQDEPGHPPGMSAWRPNPAKAYDNLERRQQVQMALQALSAPQRQAIELAYYEGLTQTQIADRLQEPLGTVKTRVRTGMEKLRDTLRPYFFAGQDQ